MARTYSAAAVQLAQRVGPVAMLAMPGLLAIGYKKELTVDGVENMSTPSVGAPGDDDYKPRDLFSDNTGPARQALAEKLAVILVGHVTWDLPTATALDVNAEALSFVLRKMQQEAAAVNAAGKDAVDALEVITTSKLLEEYAEYYRQEFDRENNVQPSLQKKITYDVRVKNAFSNTKDTALKKCHALVPGHGDGLTAPLAIRPFTEDGQGALVAAPSELRDFTVASSNQLGVRQVLALIVRLLQCYGLSAGIMEAPEGCVTLGRGKVAGKVLMLHITDVTALISAFTIFAQKEQDPTVFQNYFSSVADRMRQLTTEEKPPYSLGAAFHKATEIVTVFNTNNIVREIDGGLGKSRGSDFNDANISRKGLEKLGVPAAWINGIFENKKQKPNAPPKKKVVGGRGERGAVANKVLGGRLFPEAKPGGNANSKVPCMKDGCGARTMCNMNHSQKAGGGGGAAGGRAAPVVAGP